MKIQDLNFDQVQALANIKVGLEILETELGSKIEEGYYTYNELNRDLVLHAGNLDIVAHIGDNYVDFYLDGENSVLYFKTAKELALYWKS